MVLWWSRRRIRDQAKAPLLEYRAPVVLPTGLQKSLLCLRQLPEEGAELASTDGLPLTCAAPAPSQLHRRHTELAPRATGEIRAALRSAENPAALKKGHDVGKVVRIHANPHLLPAQGRRPHVRMPIVDVRDHNAGTRVHRGGSSRGGRPEQKTNIGRGGQRPSAADSGNFYVVVHGESMNLVGYRSGDIVAV